MHHHGYANLNEPFSQLAATVSLASDLAHQMASQNGAKPDLLSSRTDALMLFKLTADDVPALISQTQNDLNKVQGLFQMTL